MPVLVTGATGAVGRALIPKLLEAGGQVRVYVRRDVPELRAMGVKVALGDADHEGKIESALEQVHTLVHLVGGPILDKGVTVEWLNLDTTQVAVRAAENAEVRRMLFLSPFGADPSSDDPYLAAKGAAERAIVEAKMEHAIFRCAPILGEGTALAGYLERGVPSGVRAVKLNPLAIDDVAQALVAADTRDADIHGVWELGGPQVVTMGELADRAGRRRSGISRLLKASPKELASLYSRDAVADPTSAVAQFGLELHPTSDRP
jgi:uncharacterized protein YbjT (DUF2867 family)